MIFSKTNRNDRPYILGYNPDCSLHWENVASTPEVAGGNVLSGYALVWNKLSSDRGGYKAKLMPNSAVFDSEVFALYSHDYKDILGTTSNGSLVLSTDEIGVKFYLTLADTTAGRDVFELVRRKDVKGMSFGMTPQDSKMVTDPDGQQVELHYKYLVDEITITPIPAFDSTTVTVAQSEADKPITGIFADVERYKLKMMRTRLDSYEF